MFYSEIYTCKLVKISISVDGKLVHAPVDSGMEITDVKKDLVPGISVEGASTIYLKVYVLIGLATGYQVNVVHQQVLCALADVFMEDVLLPPEVLDVLGGARSEENSLAQSSQYLGGDSGTLNETEVSSRILLEKAPENDEASQRNITSCWNEVGTTITKDKEIRINDRSPITPVARPELPFQVVKLDLIGPIDPQSSKGHKYILCRVDQNRWGEAVALTSLSAKGTCETLLSIFSRTGIPNVIASDNGTNLPFQMHCDASDYGVGCCLMQQDAEGMYRPIAFASQKFKATQKNWASFEKEAWAVLYGLNKFEKWIYGAKVEII
ncbi:pro-Pol polyprotein [Nephila pilipes]|uniref:Pro-Pol polyprotein n=1 Tax=Nephila pilipes TaxID=299642 RepID=A0A8X6P5S7_NEPPI|nr:pro-Pol polyprotein [Nephila pilipes]